VVAVAQPNASARSTARTQAWVLGALAVLVLGSAVRLALGGVGAPSVSSVMLAALLWLGLWLVTLLLFSPRAAFVVAFVAMVVLDVAALAPRTIAPYDERQALYRTDQDISLAVPANASSVQVLVEAVLAGADPRFDLAGTLDDGTATTWSCPWRRGIQRLELPLPTGSSTLRLRLTGSPTRDGDYLLVYTAVNGLAAAPDAARCSVAP
jgi:hypothetical protein